MFELVLTKDKTSIFNGNAINLLEVPRPHCLREFKDIGQYNAFRQILIKK